MGRGADRRGRSRRADGRPARQARRRASRPESHPPFASPPRAAAPRSTPCPTGYLSAGGPMNSTTVCEKCWNGRTTYGPGNATMQKDCREQRPRPAPPLRPRAPRGRQSGALAGRAPALLAGEQAPVRRRLAREGGDPRKRARCALSLPRPVPPGYPSCHNARRAGGLVGSLGFRAPGFADLSGAGAGSGRATAARATSKAPAIRRRPRAGRAPARPVRPADAARPSRAPPSQ